MLSLLLKNQKFLTEANISNLLIPTKKLKIMGTLKKGNDCLTFLKRKESSRHDYNFSYLDIKAIQLALGTLVRYAPTPAQARYYFCLALNNLEEPLRTATFELTLMDNLLYVCSVDVNDEEEMQNSLDLIKTALETGVFYVEIPESYAIENPHFKDPREAFENTSKKVLKHYHLEFNEDKTGLQPSKN